MWRSIVALAVLPAISAAAERPAAPGFTLEDAKAHRLTLARFRGKVVLLNFWATWCHGCQTEIPWYQEFARTYKRRGLAVVGVSLDEDGWRSVRPYLKKQKLKYPIAIGGEDLAKAYGVADMPVSLLIDRGGRIAAAHTGVVDRDAWEAEIRTLLGER